MDEKDESRPIIIAGATIGEYLMSIASEAMQGSYEIKIHFTGKNAGQAEQLLRILREVYGWIERDRSRIQTHNTRCAYKNRQEGCDNKNADFPGRCSEQIRKNCEHYKRLSDKVLIVNQVLIEQAAGIRDL